MEFLARRGSHETGHDDAGNGAKRSDEKEDDGSHEMRRMRLGVTDGSEGRLHRSVRLEPLILGINASVAVL